MISDKMKKLVENNSVIREMFEEGKNLRKIYGDENVFDFSLGNPSVETPEKVNEAIKEILEKEDSLKVHGYMSNSGFEDVRTTIATSINKRFETDFSENNIIMTVGAASALNIIFKSNVKDVMSGYRALSYNFVKTFPCISRRFEVETEMTIHALDKNFLISDIPINYKDRVTGSQSKLNTYSDGFKVLSMIYKLFRDYKPAAFFGLISLIFLIISISFGTPVFIEYFKTGLVPRFPTLIFSGFMLIISILLFICGIILEVVVRKHRQLFELILINTKK